MGLIGWLVGSAMDANKAIKQNNAKNNDSVQTITVNNLYSIDVPTYLSSTTKLSKDASLQYWNKTLDVTMQVIEEPKQGLIDVLRRKGLDKERSMLENVALFTLASIFEDLDKVELFDKDSCQINGLDALTLNAFQKRTFFKDGVYASLAFVEGKSHVYQIMIISGGSSISKLADKLQPLLYSFKEL